MHHTHFFELEEIRISWCTTMCEQTFRYDNYGKNSFLNLFSIFFCYRIWCTLMVSNVVSQFAIMTPASLLLIRHDEDRNIYFRNC